ncbi:hypothetical protein QN277_005749 [Acacia crassicarpa]|uniref:F-box domain-containing protein n=1 Tax=Acacia crassicarpa TaxID=499986 RepID=A0AAE1JU65_9FABA|nr:hypothetical protein QN277_005749 [Acacia crassicarpa]
MKMDGAAPFLPEEIIRNILKRLPVKSLTRFRCVCKDWKNLFKSPSFIADHLHHSNRQNPSLLFQPYREGQYISQLYVLDRGMQVRELPSVPLFGASRFRVVGSSYGLLCVEIDVQGIYPPPLLLFNPATRDVIKLPRTVDDFKCECYLGFGFSPIVNDYKIVRTYAEPKDCIYRVEVYSLSTGSWDDDEYYQMQMPGAIFFADAITANGSMFWIGLQLDLDTDEDETDLDMDGEKTRVIFSFDIASEEFDCVPIPALGNNSLYQLMVYEDKLAILSHVKDAELSCMFDLWVMEEHMDASDRKRRSWTKIFSSTCSAVGYWVPSIFWRGELVYNVCELPGLVGETKCEAENGLSTAFMLLNISTGEVKIFKTRSCGDRRARIFNYEESLVPVGKIPIKEPSS